MIQNQAILVENADGNSRKIQPACMQAKQIVDFIELPSCSPEKYLNSVEQICILCGLNRRTSSRIGKVIFRILNYFPPAHLLEHSIYLVPLTSAWSLYFRFVTDPEDLSNRQNVQRNPKTAESLCRIGQKLQSFEVIGGPADGYTIEFSQNLDVGFEAPSTLELKQWGRIVAKGSWDEAFELVSKSYMSDRNKLKQLRDGISIRREVLDDNEQQTNTILSLVASKTDNAVFLLDAKGKIEWLNQACCQTFGVESGNCIKRNVAELVFDLSAEASPDQVASIDQFSESLASGRSFSVEYFRETDIERSLWTAFQLTPVRDEHDRIARWIGIGSDVTQRRKAEFAILAAKQVAETANKAKSEFLAMMSHEIRTPMNAIIGMTELTLGTQLTAEQREFLTTAQNSANSLLQILNDILDLSKVEASRLEIEQIDFNLADLVRDTINTLGFLSNTKGITLRCEFSMEIPQELVGDPVRIRQIMVNLVGNAIKFTAEGEVVFACELTDESDENVTIHFSVRDTGVGIAEEKTSRIFEAFYQTDASVTRNFGGTGLGLAITSELIRLMGGRIWVESRLGNGSTFHFVLTFPKSSRSAIGLSTKMIEPLAGKSILIVESDEANQQFLVNLLNGWGVATNSVASGTQALEFMDNNRLLQWDIVVLESRLSETGGFDAVRRLQELQGQNVTPVMMISPDHRLKNVEQCRQMGIDELLVKPISPRTLNLAIHNALRRSVASAAKRAENCQPKVGKPSVAPLDILVVDDHPSNRTLACELLRRRGHRLTQASSGLQSIELIKQKLFDVVLMDVQMPELDGLQSTMQIRELSGARSEVPVIAVTAYVTPEDRQRCIDARMDDYLAKPLNLNELIEKVERWGRTRKLRGAHRSLSQTHFGMNDVPAWAVHVARDVAVAANNGQDEPNELVSPGSNSKSASGVCQTGPLNCQSSQIAADTFPFAAALARLGGDDELLRMQMGFFVDETPQLLRNLASAITNKDDQSLRVNAHRLKGLVRSYDDPIAEELATTLEFLGREGNFEKAETTRCVLETRVDKLTQEITQYRNVGL